MSEPARSAPPRRIVSLVPSLSEALFELGLGERVVGVTDWCVHPAAAVAPLPKVGGTKNPDLGAIVALRPDLVIANREENTERAVRKLREAGLAVWVTYPTTVRDGAELLRDLAERLAAPEARARPLVAGVLAAVERAEAARARPGDRRVAVFCPIWRDPWMAVGGDTYASDLLTLCGGRNLAASHPGGRYPRVTLAEIESASPEVILLPDEPYAFGARDVRDLARLACPAARNGRIHPIDGTLLSWYGPRIERALRLLQPLLAC